MSVKKRIAEPPPRLQATVVHSHCVGDSVYVIRLHVKKLTWTPGDCIAVYASTDSPVSRPYSLCGDNRLSELELLVRQFPGGKVSEPLCHARPGETVWISPPFGFFRPAEPATADKLYFATGTGIAPFASAMRSGCCPPRQCLWGLREEFELELEGSVTKFISGSGSGRVTRSLETISFTSDTHIYACGLDRMVEEVTAYFSRKGLPEHQLHRECFFTAPPA